MLDQEMTLSVAKSETLRRKTLNVLRDAIISGHFTPGQKLVERDLCAQTGVSRSSLREALRHLESEGLVESRETKGLFVASLTLEVALEIYEVRAALESEAARHFAKRATDAELDELEATFALMKNTPIQDRGAFLEASDRFYEILFAGARNSTANHLMQSLRARISLLRATTTRRAPAERREGTVELMSRILEALKKRDGEAAARACRALIGRSAQFAAECLRE
jgi:DNA-binding GntR family transcriptional regulator